MDKVKKIGEFLKTKRLQKGMSLRDVSKLTGISHAHVSAIEQGTSSTSFDKAIALLNIYQTTLQELESETGYTLKNNTIELSKMPDGFIKRLNEDIQKKGEEVWDKISISKEFVRSVLRGKGILPRKDVIELSRTLDQPIHEYLLLSDYLPQECEIIKHSSAVDMFKTLNTLSPEEIDQVVGVLNRVLSLYVQRKIE